MIRERSRSPQGPGAAELLRDLVRSVPCYTIVTVDEYNMLFAGLSPHNIDDMALFMRDLLLSPDLPCQFVVTGSTSAAVVQAALISPSNGADLWTGSATAFGNLSQDWVAQRTRQLQHYLTTLLQVPDVSADPLVVEFLCPSTQRSWRRSVPAGTGEFGRGHPRRSLAALSVVVGSVKVSSQSPEAESVTDLPETLLVRIFSFLGYRDLLSAGAVCKAFNRAAVSNPLWLRICRELVPPWPQIFPTQRALDAGAHSAFVRMMAACREQRRCFQVTGRLLHCPCPSRKMLCVAMGPAANLFKAPLRAIQTCYDYSIGGAPAPTKATHPGYAMHSVHVEQGEGSCCLNVHVHGRGACADRALHYFLLRANFVVIVFSSCEDTSLNALHTAALAEAEIDVANKKLEQLPPSPRRSHAPSLGTLVTKEMTRAARESFLQQLKSFAIDSALDQIAKLKDQEALADSVKCFVSQMTHYIEQTLLWQNATESEKELLAIHVEDYVFSRLYKCLVQSVKDESKDAEVGKRIEKLAFLLPSHLEIPESHWDYKTWHFATEKLLEISEAVTPRRKLDGLLSASKAVLSLLCRCSAKDKGADSFLPHIIYITIRANPPNLITSLQFIKTFMEEDSFPEGRYYMTTFEAALEFIDGIDHSRLHIKQEDFERLTSAAPRIRPSLPMQRRTAEKAYKVCGVDPSQNKVKRMLGVEELPQGVPTSPRRIQSHVQLDNDIEFHETEPSITEQKSPRLLRQHYRLRHTQPRRCPHTLFAMEKFALRVFDAHGSYKTFALDPTVDARELEDMCQRKFVVGDATPHFLSEYKEEGPGGVAFVRVPEWARIADVVAAWPQGAAGVTHRLVYSDGGHALTNDVYKKPTRTQARDGEYKEPHDSPRASKQREGSLSLKDKTDNVQAREREVVEFMNEHLSQRGLAVQDLYADLRSGVLLVEFLECFSGLKVQQWTRTPEDKAEEIANLNSAIKFIRVLGCGFTGVIGEDLYYGDPAVMLRMLAIVVQHLRKMSPESVAQRGQLIRQKSIRNMLAEADSESQSQSQSRPPDRPRPPVPPRRRPDANNEQAGEAEAAEDVSHAPPRAPPPSCSPVRSPEVEAPAVPAPLPRPTGGAPRPVPRPPPRNAVASPVEEKTQPAAVPALPPRGSPQPGGAPAPAPRPLPRPAGMKSPGPNPESIDVPAPSDAAAEAAPEPVVCPDDVDVGPPPCADVPPPPVEEVEEAVDVPPPPASDAFDVVEADALDVGPPPPVDDYSVDVGPPPMPPPAAKPKAAEPPRTPPPPRQPAAANLDDLFLKEFGTAVPEVKSRRKTPKRTSGLPDRRSEILLDLDKLIESDTDGQEFEETSYNVDLVSGQQLSSPTGVRKGEHSDLDDLLADLINA
eukprot:m51a1_g3568 hypothetical protein (1378) ;mRNA; f:1080935-1091773